MAGGVIGWGSLLRCNIRSLSRSCNATLPSRLASFRPPMSRRHNNRLECIAKTGRNSVRNRAARFFASGQSLERGWRKDKDAGVDEAAEEGEFEELEEEDLTTEFELDEELVDENGEDEIDDMAAVDEEDGFITTNNVPWGENALELAKEVLRRDEFSERLGLYSFKVVPNAGCERVIIRLDSYENSYGSPQLEDIQEFSKAFRRIMEEREPDLDVATEVSSPGAERYLKLPTDLDRFQGMPMRVCYTDGPEGGGKVEVLDLVSPDEEGMGSSNPTTLWKLADVRFNWRKMGKKAGQGLNSKERKMRFRIPLNSIRSVRLHLDV